LDTVKSMLREFLSGLMMSLPGPKLQVVSEQDINHFKIGLSRYQKSGSSNLAGKSSEEFYSGYAKQRFY